MTTRFPAVNAREVVRVLEGIDFKFLLKKCLKNMKLDEIKKILAGHKADFRKKFKLKEIGIFGSYVQGEEKETSDIDILVDFAEPVGFFKFLELEEYIESLLHTKVDLVSKKALKPRIGQYILKEVVYV